MADPHSISILRRKRDDIRDAIAAYEARLAQAQADLAHVNAALRLFEATGNPIDFPAYVDINRVLRRGETTKICFAALAEEGPMDTRQLTERVMKAKGLDFGDKVIAQTISLRVVQTLRVRAIRKGDVCGAERRRGVCVWRLSDGWAGPTPS